MQKIVLYKTLVGLALFGAIVGSANAAKKLDADQKACIVAAEEHRKQCWKKHKLAAKRANLFQSYKEQHGCELDFNILKAQCMETPVATLTGLKTKPKK